jgi:hypothetical protein
MFQVFYNRFKLIIWLVLAVLLASGAVSNYYNGTKAEVFLNGALAVAAFIIFLVSLLNRFKAKK